VIQSATLPSAPWKPNYHRDAAIVIAASLLLAWLAAWLADFLTRREAGPSVIVAPTTLAYPINMPEMIQQQPMPILGPSVPTAQLPAPHDLPRELDEAELSAMLEAADEDTRLALGALLCGVSPEELIGLTWNDIDLDVGTIKILHPAARSIAIGAEFNSVLRKTKQQKSGQESDTLLGTTGGAPSLSHVEALISYAAHDAGLAQPAQITPWSVRHTYISYLVRQGIRFSELARIVGTIPAEVTAAYGASLPATARRSLDQIDPVIPALRAFARDFAQTYGPA
jgi:polysaccharide biosynthesis transport protein